MNPEELLQSIISMFILSTTVRNAININGKTSYKTRDAVYIVRGAKVLELQESTLFQKHHISEVLEGISTCA